MMLLKPLILITNFSSLHDWFNCICDVTSLGKRERGKYHTHNNNNINNNNNNNIIIIVPTSLVQLPVTFHQHFPPT